MRQLRNEGFTRVTWVILRAARNSEFRQRPGNSQSPIEYALQGPHGRDRLLTGKAALHEVLCRFLRRKPVLAVDIDVLIAGLANRYSTELFHLPDYPSRRNSIGYVRAKHLIVYADAECIGAPNLRVQQKIENAIEARNRMLATKKYADITGMHREQMILLTEAKAL